MRRKTKPKPSAKPTRLARGRPPCTEAKGPGKAERLDRMARAQEEKDHRAPMAVDGNMIGEFTHRILERMTQEERAALASWLRSGAFRCEPGADVKIQVRGKPQG